MSQVVLTEKPVPVLDPSVPRRPVDEAPAPAPEPASASSPAEVAPEPSPRAAFQRRCERIAQTLATSTFEERLRFYKKDGFTYRELSTAAALCPDLMPVLNGEYEWIALTLADRD